jgi:hypothetical protein
MPTWFLADHHTSARREGVVADVLAGWQSWRLAKLQSKISMPPPLLRGQCAYTGSTGNQYASR